MIKKLTYQLQKEIDKKMNEFAELGKLAKSLRKELDDIHLKMGTIVQDLQPVDSLIRTQNPEMCELFDSLLELTQKTKKKD